MNERLLEIARKHRAHYVAAVEKENDLIKKAIELRDKIVNADKSGYAFHGTAEEAIKYIHSISEGVKNKK